MIETIEEKILRFKIYNRTMMAAAVSKRNRRFQGLPAKLLLCSMLDSLSIAAFPNEVNVGVRYKKTIADYSNWNDHDRVSLLQLNNVLVTLNSLPSKFDGLKNWVNTEVSKRFPSTNRLVSRHVELDKDPLFGDVLPYWPVNDQGVPEKLGKFFPEDFTHRGLLWKYRNKLAHEFRLPGRGAQSRFRWEDQPYYQEISSVTKLDSVNGLIFDNRWELTYPTGFFLTTVKEALENICQKYTNDEVSPFLSYSEGSSWL